MTRLVLFLLLSLTGIIAWPDQPDHGLQVEVKRDGDLYTFAARFDTTLTKCAAYRYLTDYQSDKDMPGVLESRARRESANRVKVERTVDERILLFDVRLHSVMEYTEKPYDSISFTQLAGDSKSFRGSWTILANRQGSTLSFKGLWEPDTVVPLFIIDHFAESGLADKFRAIALLAEKRAQQGPGQDPRNISRAAPEQRGDAPANACTD